MAANTAEALILSHPTNPMHNPGYVTQSDKVWAQDFKAIKTVTTQTIIGGDGKTHANFEDSFMKLQDDDALRFREPAVHPNNRLWRLETEADCENWFNSEITNVVLSAWNTYPPITQSSHTKPISEENITENIDCTFSVKIGNQRRTVAIGEFKRNLISAEWQTGSINKSGQRTFSKELRGYAHKYQCPQVFCFDGARLILLQFRAFRLDDIKEESCKIDCWVFPVKTSSCSLRYALYRLLAQGWRRCQGELAPACTIGGLQPYAREFFTGLPIWRYNNQKSKSHPAGYQRTVDQRTGALAWIHQAAQTEFETGTFW
ncbi:hypothetical protein FOMA001_g17346 [Fusarium oxysporum f. sp. matthiolae]|nr:hypothetical protein FOMA001_g17346 [Fusarium oxysporum f. sp. matthiolae]